MQTHIFLENKMQKTGNKFNQLCFEDRRSQKKFEVQFTFLSYFLNSYKIVSFLCIFFASREYFKLLLTICSEKCLPPMNVKLLGCRTDPNILKKVLFDGRRS